MFTRDNTDGLYTAADLDILNLALDRLLQAETSVAEWNRADLEKDIGEWLLSVYRPGMSVRELELLVCGGEPK